MDFFGLFKSQYKCWLFLKFILSPSDHDTSSNKWKDLRNAENSLTTIFLIYNIKFWIINIMIDYVITNYQYLVSRQSVHSQTLKLIIVPAIFISLKCVQKGKSKMVKSYMKIYIYNTKNPFLQYKRCLVFPVQEFFEPFHA